MAWLVWCGVILLTIGLVSWGRWVWRRHEDEALYEPGDESRSHAKDPGYLSNISDGGGGMGGGV